MTEREQRLVFGEVAATYDRVRPTYPPALLDDVVEVAGLAPGARVLEVGAGTGKATVALAARGLEVTAVEPDPAMAAILRERVPAATVLVTPFEQVRPDPGGFDAVVAAQAWHWVDADRGYARAADLLRPGGWLALWWNHPDGVEGAVGGALDEPYRRHAPDIGERRRAWHVADRDVDRSDELARSGRFGDVVVREHRWSRTYPTAEYVALLSTQSDHRMLAPDTRAALLDEVAAVLDAHGGAATVRYRSRLFAAPRTA